MAIAIAGCDRTADTGPDATQAAHPILPAKCATAATPAPWFRDVTGAAGIHFRHTQGRKLWYLPQSTGSGMAMLDMDGDGQLDLFFVQGSGPDDLVSVRGHGFVPVGALAAPDRSRVEPVDRGRVPRCELYRNRDGRFEECAGAAALDCRGFGMAALALDYDNDGYEDLFVSGYQQATQLFHNNGDGTFTQVEAHAGLIDKGLVWATSLTAIDYDRDGFPDLYLGQYIGYEPKDWIAHPEINWDPHAPGPVTLLPTRYPPLDDVLMRNRGDGTFEDRTAQSGLATVPSQTMSVLAADLDGDGWPDLMTANDGRSCNRVFQNRGGGRFADVSAHSGADEYRGSMGIAAGDVDLDGRLDVLVTHWFNSPALYRAMLPPRERPGWIRYLDQAEKRGLGMPERLVAWGVGFLDVDNDSFEDILQVDGDAEPPSSAPTCGRMQPERAYLYRNDGHGIFARQLPRGCEDPLAKERVGRGVAFGDIDRDGTIDVALSNNNQPAELWVNRGGSAAWIGLDPVGSRGSRSALGTRVTLEQGKRRRYREVASGEGYFGTNSRQLVFGLGTDERPVLVTARWLSGRVEVFPHLPVRRYHRLVEGTGAEVMRAPLPQPTRTCPAGLADAMSFGAK